MVVEWSKAWLATAASAICWEETYEAYANAAAAAAASTQYSTTIACTGSKPEWGQAQCGHFCGQGEGSICDFERTEALHAGAILLGD
ncbi:hypothetical protein Nepgr_008320 [Nepenthes gracilis]|uniref:Uncharacterized protein n=1 Tax=Nepenthes gracilis TaxID=150966 RepID=A0AAD3XJ98_NEPGR|nr:hypothetical protein Nepgr_008320 [Nepenthes gracilis]